MNKKDNLMLYRLIARVATYLDRVIEDHGLGDRYHVAFHHEWPRARLGTWRYSDGSIVVECWRFQLVIDKGLPWVVKR